MKANSLINHGYYKYISCSIVTLAILFCLTPSRANSQNKSGTEEILKNETISLDQCISLALEYNYRKKISGEDIKIAESQLRQAKSALYPEISFNANFSIMDEDLVFQFPEQTFTFDMPPIPGFQFKGIKTETLSAKLLDNKNLHAQLGLKYPLFTGGKISAINLQAEKNLEIARIGATKEEREIIFDVKLYYYSYLLAGNLLKLCNETSEILDATLRLTESLYQNGSGRVTKIDYLKNKVIVDQVKILLTDFEKNYNKSKEALLFVTGNALSPEFKIASFDIPYTSLTMDINEVEKNIFVSNPDWMKINSALSICQAKSDEAKSGLFPGIGLFASFDGNFNEYEYGIVNNNNKYMATIGIGISYEIFSGFGTRSAIEEAAAGINKITLEKELLSDVLKLQLKNIFHELSACESNIGRQAEALKTAEENRSLTERAFQQELADADELVQAQIMEALVKAQYQKALYEYAIEKARLELLSGMEL